MPRIAFADESGTDVHSRCYTIGLVCIPADRHDWLTERLVNLKATHGVVGEAKWTKVRNSHGLINFALDCLALVLETPDVTFDAIVVNKRLYRNWQGTSAQQEVAFYKTYTYLLRHIVRRLKDETDVVIDAKSDRYGKRDEAMLTIGNRMLVQLAATGRLGRVSKATSHDVPAIQMADMLTGAINTAHMLRLQTIAIHPGKHLAIERLATQVGWNHLAHDTYPHPKFNVWHFPIEFRGPSRDPVSSGRVPYVTAADLLAG
jgi:hypothetical protein